MSALLAHAISRSKSGSTPRRGRTLDFAAGTGPMPLLFVAYQL
jgi:hypothetical protein